MMFVDTYNTGKAATFMKNIGLMRTKTTKNNEGDESYIRYGEK